MAIYLLRIITRFPPVSIGPTKLLTLTITPGVPVQFLFTFDGTDLTVQVIKLRV